MEGNHCLSVKSEGLWLLNNLRLMETFAGLLLVSSLTQSHRNFQTDFKELPNIFENVLWALKTFNFNYRLVCPQNTDKRVTQNFMSRMKAMEKKHEQPISHP